MTAGVSVVSNVTVATGEGRLNCLCLTKIPPLDDLNGFLPTIVSSAAWAILYDQFDPSRFIDQFTELEYLYRESAELLLNYKSKDGMLFGTTLRRSKVSPGDQNFWYGFTAEAEALWK